jgi:small subunit ribosomal protein S17
MTKESIKVKKGVIVSDKMDKTVVVQIDRIKTHPIYKKKFVMSQKFKAHDEKNEYKTGDLVEITETRPISGDKKFKVLRKVV